MSMVEKGKFVVIEGVDGSGKTSTIEKVVKIMNNTNIQVTNGFERNSAWDKYIDSHPQSILYYLTLLYKAHAQVVPALEKGNHVIQDRYKQTVDTFEPDASYFINQMFMALADPLFLQPNIYVLFLADLETLVQRLSEENQESFSEYHQSLIDSPDSLAQRQERYKKAYETLDCPKYCIDTTQTTVDEAATQLITIFERNGIC